MKTKTILLYEYDELPEEIQEIVREKFAEYVFSDSGDWEHIFDDAVEVGKILGIEIDSRSVRLTNGHTVQAPAIFFSGFCSQGDGACFEGRYAYAKQAHTKIKQYAPLDWELHRIALELFKLQKRHQYLLTARCLVSGRYSHSGSMSVNVENANGVVPDSTEEDLTQLMRDFADWIYAQLEKAYDYQRTTEALEETIRANEYYFTEKGEREEP